MPLPTLNPPDLGPRLETQKTAALAKEFHNLCLDAMSKFNAWANEKRTEMETMKSAYRKNTTEIRGMSNGI
jgi:hypothetical protein